MSSKPSKVLAHDSQFSCPFCGKGYDQKSRLQRHAQTAHPPSAPSASDVEKALKGIRYPKTKEELFEIAIQRTAGESPGLLTLIDSLPKRNYRDSAEVAIAFGELKSGKRPRAAASVAKLESPSKKGGRSALKSRKISASRIARVLKGINFPKSKRSIIGHVRKQHDSDKEEIISVLHKISDKKYLSMIQVEIELGRVK
ncbi:MAG: DUF2795 domain-containing protein [Thaumarchaeota archaeon]|nr:MAG: DUF2795 domain-containing protein [Nitrososphaerota archaeon]TLX88018.1 MAG: DUF2795 domain-containing protein [Nitrososphaerota archaeon]